MVKLFHSCIPDKLVTLIQAKLFHSCIPDKPVTLIQAKLFAGCCYFEAGLDSAIILLIQSKKAPPAPGADYGNI